MRKIKVFVVFVLFLGWGASAQAILIDNGDGTVTDTSSGLMWLKDSTLNQGVTWEAANAWAGSVTVGGFDDWRLASALDSNGLACTGANCVDTEFGSLFYTALGNMADSLVNSDVFIIDLDRTWFWTATNSGQACGNFGCVDLPYYFQFETGLQSAGLWAVNPLNTWAVRSVTEPPVWALMGLGLFLVGRQRVKRQRL